MAIRRVVKMLQRLHRKEPGATVYGVHLDVKKYFPSTPHDELKEMDKRRISEERFLPFLYEIIDSNKDERTRIRSAREGRDSARRSINSTR